MSRTIVDIDPDLLDMAKKVSGQTTNTGAVNTALRKMVSTAALDELIQDLASMDDESRHALTSARQQW